MHQEFAVQIDAEHHPEVFLPLHREKQGVTLHQSGNISSGGDVLPQLPASATAFLVYSAKRGRQGFSGALKRHYSREEKVLVQKRWEFGSMTRGLFERKERDVWVLLETQYGSQCE